MKYIIEGEAIGTNFAVQQCMDEAFVQHLGFFLKAVCKSEVSLVEERNEEIYARRNHEYVKSCVLFACIDGYNVRQRGEGGIVVS